jgi:protein-export membrane protein SecD
MVYITRFQMIVIALILSLGAVFSLPNFIPQGVRDALPGWVPKATMNLGLDLQGGSYLLLEVDMPGVLRERMETLRDDIRASFRRDRIVFENLTLGRDGIGVSIPQEAQREAARKILRDFAVPPGTLLGIGTSEYDLTDDGKGAFSLKMTAGYQRTMQTGIVGQSIEVVRRRIDEVGTREPTIQQQGEDRILVQVPGLKNPEELKRLLSTTAKMSFRLVDTNGNIQDALRGRVPLESELLYEAGPNNTPVPYLVQRRVIVSGDRLQAASPGFDQRTGQAVVNFRFDTRGAKEFGDATKVNTGKPFAIILDNKVI